MPRCPKVNWRRPAAVGPAVYDRLGHGAAGRYPHHREDHVHIVVPGCDCTTCDAETMTHGTGLRAARLGDTDELLDLWRLLFDDDPVSPWADHARRWFADVVHDPRVARVTVVEVGGRLAACAVGTLELGVPNPFCVRGRTVRLANVVTRPEFRGRGYGTALVEAVVAWAREIDVDRVDLSATPEGYRLYERAGFTPTSAPRMKLALDRRRARAGDLP